MDKPRSPIIHPEITRLPEGKFWRTVVRRLVHWICRIFIWLMTKPEVKGLELFPAQGPAILVSNHLGDTDLILGIAYLHANVDILAKAELYDFPLLGKLMDAYGVIWVHRGQADRRTLRVASESLKLGRILAIAPEGRESITASLETGTQGAAYLALKSGAMVYPVTITGTENARIFGNIKRFHRTRVTMELGKGFLLEADISMKKAMEQGTDKIMVALARQLPAEYQGVFHNHPKVSGEHS